MQTNATEQVFNGLRIETQVLSDKSKVYNILWTNDEGETIRIDCVDRRRANRLARAIDECSSAHFCPTRGAL